MTAKAATAAGARANPATICGFDQPHSGPRLMAKSREVAPTASTTAPR
jgi:hypothetical protein